jgi:hypothetical protein
MYTVWTKQRLLLLKQVIHIVTTVPSNGSSVVVTVTLYSSINISNIMTHDVLYFLIRHYKFTKKLSIPH